jgi:hypothetical protein
LGGSSAVSTVTKGNQPHTFVQRPNVP